MGHRDGPGSPSASARTKRRRRVSAAPSVILSVTFPPSTGHFVTGGCDSCVSRNQLRDTADAVLYRGHFVPPSGVRAACSPSALRGLSKGAARTGRRVRGSAPARTLSIHPAMASGLPSGCPGVEDPFCCRLHSVEADLVPQLGPPVSQGLVAVLDARLAGRLLGRSEGVPVPPVAGDVISLFAHAGHTSGSC